MTYWRIYASSNASSQLINKRWDVQVAVPADHKQDLHAAQTGWHRSSVKPSAQSGPPVPHTCHTPQSSTVSSGHSRSARLPDLHLWLCWSASMDSPDLPSWECTGYQAA
jgi:hypothetical protein